MNECFIFLQGCALSVSSSCKLPTCDLTQLDLWVIVHSLCVFQWSKFQITGYFKKWVKTQVYVIEKRRQWWGALYMCGNWHFTLAWNVSIPSALQSANPFLLGLPASFVSITFLPEKRLVLYIWLPLASCSQKSLPFSIIALPRPPGQHLPPETDLPHHVTGYLK